MEMLWLLFYFIFWEMIYRLKEFPSINNEYFHFCLAFENFLDDFVS